ncbi:hypothetical protein BDY21DRAFT_278147 [Lineolata rhizophorae]|uniref:Ribosomal protein S36, mitochondrial n=1 Tax=Lineolata rhizophorae TaxID=578093 RepID=A0A6A6PC26_9PEZI|nr:hypothetical protein BDY21DRAFT_278147 [Lineolata rhizophorae]
MRATLRLLSGQRQPMIRFVGKRHPTHHADPTPQTHPAAPAPLPNTFASYRQTAQQHGPLNKPFHSLGTAPAPGRIGAQPASALGDVRPARGEAWDRNELPARFRRRPLTPAEIEAVESGGASVYA